MNEIKGSGVALVTPFDKNGSVDYKGLENLLHYVIEGGADFLVLMGTTGESTTILKNEKIRIINFCREINNGRLPIVLGVGGNNTSEVINEINSEYTLGADAILSASPAYNKPTQTGIYQHYKMIAESTSLPIILYNVPTRTASNISAETTLRLSNDVKNIVGIKEASGDMDQIMKILQNKSNDFIVLSGDDGLTLPMIYMGAEGAISVICQSHPKEFSNMVSFGLSGNKRLANEIHYKLYNLYGPLYSEGNPVGIKACLENLGICKAYVRLPLVEASDKIKNELKLLL